MSTSQRTTTRRSALQSALTGLIAAGAASMLPSTTSAAQEPVSVHQAPVVVNYADLSAACEQAKAESRRTLEAACALIGFPEAGLTKKQRKVVDAHETALMEHLEATQDWYVAELARHFPGLAPAIVAVWEHVMDEASHGAGCCEVGAE